MNLVYCIISTSLKLVFALYAIQLLNENYIKNYRHLLFQ